MTTETRAGPFTSSKEELIALIGTERVGALSRRALPNACLREIAVRFEIEDFELFEREMLKAVRRYILGRATPVSGVTMEAKQAYRKLIKEIAGLQTDLSEFAHGYLGDRIHHGARLQGEVDLPDIQDIRACQDAGENLCDRLKQLLTYLRKGCELELEEMIARDRGGPRRNGGLEAFLTTIMVYWEWDLGRDFTLDHHKGAAWTPAFEFSKALVTRIEPLTDQQIITGMRRVIGERGTLRNPHKN